MIRYYKLNDTYIGISEEAPKGMRNVIAVGRGPVKGFGVEGVCEQGYPISLLKTLTEVQAKDVPDDWFAAIGLEERPKPMVVEKRKRRIVMPSPFECSIYAAVWVIIAYYIIKIWLV